jgi:Pectinacetylesterase
MPSLAVRPLLGLVVAGLVVVSACGGSDVPTSSVAPDAASAPRSNPTVPVAAPTATEPTATEPASTAPSNEPTSTAPASTAGLDAWTSVDPGPDCECADGSDFELWDRRGDPTRVVLYFEGGGACFSAESCSFTDGTYTSSIEIGEPPSGRDGLFDQTNAENPIARHSMVYVPYCTGDVHIGNATTEYAADLTVEHNGFVNATAGLDHVVETYPDVEQLIVMGASAGSIPTPLFAALAADRLPNAEVITFGDSSGAYPDVPVVNETIGRLWGSTTVIPDWPENAGLGPADWSLPGLYVQAGKHDPDITFARFDYAFDQVQASFGALAGVGADELVTLIDETAAQAETSGVPLASYVAPGTDHTIVGDDAFYDMEVEGVRLVDWFTALVDGETPADVRCVECDSP